MVRTTIATMILTKSQCRCEPVLPSVPPHPLFCPLNVRYNICKGEINFPGCRLAAKATSGFPTKQYPYCFVQLPFSASRYDPTGESALKALANTVIDAMPLALTLVIV